MLWVFALEGGISHVPGFHLRNTTTQSTSSSHHLGNFGSQGVPLQRDFQPIGVFFKGKHIDIVRVQGTLETHLGFDIYSFFGGDGVYKYVYMKGTWKHDFIEGVHYLFTKIGKESWLDVIKYSFFDGDSCQRLAILGQALVSIGPSALFVEHPQNKHKLVRPKFFSLLLLPPRDFYRFFAGTSWNMWWNVPYAIGSP